MLNVFNDIKCHTSLTLALLFFLALIYEAINGFHDTANSVAIVIYTNSLRPKISVILSGIFNFLGVVMGGLSVAYTIIHLLPLDLLLNIHSIYGLYMIQSILIISILWNLGTWYLRLPISSSHTLIGSIIGICLTHAFVNHNSIIQALNIKKLTEVILSLFISPIIGLTIAGICIFILRKFFHRSKKKLHKIHLTPLEREKQYKKKKPPLFIRIALIISAAGVSFSHGANDGQKGIGLIMLILISTIPSNFSINMHSKNYDIIRTRDAMKNFNNYCIQYKNLLMNLDAFNNQSEKVSFFVEKRKNFDEKIQFYLKNIKNYKVNVFSKNSNTNSIKKHKNIQSFNDFFLKISYNINCAIKLLNKIENYKQLNFDERYEVRALIMCISNAINQIKEFPHVSYDNKKFLNNLQDDLLKTVEYAPLWIIIIVAIVLSLSTMVCWKRVTVTISEKIGKKSMTYAQGLSAQLTSAISIGIASYTGMPVSTTHVLSSAVTGVMLVDGSGIQITTIKNILISWILTMPVTITMSSILYLILIKLYI